MITTSHPENFKCTRCHAEMQITEDKEGLECGENCNNHPDFVKAFLRKQMEDYDAKENIPETMEGTGIGEGKITNVEHAG